MTTYRALHLFCGLGGGALGFQEAEAFHKGLRGRFQTLVGIDNDPEACKDFEALTGAPSLCRDVATMELEDMRAATGGIAPDVVFTSPPCKGFSGLLSNSKASTDRYQALNRLVFQGLYLILEAFDRKPRLILLENVPRIQNRGKVLLRQVRELLMRYGYVFHEGTHDCGELGGLSQHRRRFLMIARHAPQVPTFVYRPESQPVRTIGQCLERLPMPDVPEAGPMHRLPRLQWKTLVRLALIPAGGDWRALGTKDDDEGPYKHSFRVVPWDQPAGTVTTAYGPSCGAISVADPRFERVGYNNKARVVGWDETSVAVTGGTGPSSGAVNVADPRFPAEHRRGVYKVVRWDEASGTVTGEARASTGPFSVADPRFGCQMRAGHYGVQRWDEPAGTVVGAADVHAGAAAIADPRLNRPSRPNLYGVMRWDEPAKTVTGSAQVSGSNGTAAVADPRAPTSADDHPPVILSEDGTWHRPLTTLELAALQGLPVRRLMGQPLAGSAHGRWRERIGNAVPPPTARAIGSSVLKALLATSAGDTFTLGSGSIWVRKVDAERLGIVG